MFGRERYYLKIVTLISSLWCLLQVALVIYIDPKNDTFFWILGAFVAPFIMLLIGEEKVFGIFAKLLDWRGRRENIAGDWLIRINFDEDDVLNQRVGSLKIVRGAIGYRVLGGNLHDSSNADSKTMHGWQGREVNLINSGANQLLVYVYETKDKESDQHSNRIGVVVAGRDEKVGQFKGSFHDFAVSDTQSKLRNGSVALIPDNKDT